MAGETVTLRIDGPVIKDPYPLHDLVGILGDFHSIVDQSFLVLSGRSRITRSERLNFRILASRPQPGSYIQELQILYDIAEPLLPLVPLLPQLTSPDIWKSAKAAYEFLKAVVSLRRQGKELTVSAPNNEGIVVVSAPGSQPITIHQNIFNIAERSEDPYKRITTHIERGRIDTITAIDGKKEGISLSEKEKELFNPETKLEDTPVDVIGSVFDFNKDKLTGKIRVVEGQPISARDYNFDLVKGQDPITYILAMTKELVSMRCLPEIFIHTTGTKVVHRLQAISIKDVS
jgi:hypothetical protein